MVAALGLRGYPGWLNRGVAHAFAKVSLPLARTLARFDDEIEPQGIHLASAQVLHELGASWERANATAPLDGPLLVVANHPGAYDALALLAAIGRSDVAVIAAERRFLRALPNLSRRLLWVGEDKSSTRSASAVRKALRHLSNGGALLHFGAGRIEPDPAFVDQHGFPLRTWRSGTGALVRGTAAVGGVVVSALVMGVHSPRVKQLLITRVAERFGISTLAALLQVTISRYRDVLATVRFAEPCLAAELMRDGSSDEQLTELVRAKAAALWSRS